MANETKSVAVRGLEGVIAADTRIGYVDGVNGKLYYAGYDINDLAGKVCFEEVVFLLWNDRLPDRSELAELRQQLIAEMVLPEPLMDWFKRIPGETHPMVVLRSAVSDLAAYDPEAEDNSPEANRRKAIRLVARIPAIIAAYYRALNRGAVLAPDTGKGLAENFLRIFLEREVTEQEAEAIELMFVLHADHGFNASTFSARVTASTLADIYAAITAAVATLSGALHGGANQRVMEMLTRIGDVSLVDEYIDGMLEKKEKVMGFGHRVYKVEDPRASHLRRISARLCERDQQCEYVEMSALIEKKVMAALKIHPNVDFYSASVQHSLGIPARFYTTLFAASRIAGWSAHVLEQHADNRLMRPRSNFTGRYPREFVPLAKRS